MHRKRVVGRSLLLAACMNMKKSKRKRVGGGESKRSRCRKSKLLRHKVDAEEEKKLLYVFLRHHGGHSLYALDVPTGVDDDDGRITAATTITVANQQPPRTRVDPVLSFDLYQYPKNMSCASMGKHLYFLGGVKLHFEDYRGELIDTRHSLSTQVFLLDLTSFSSVDDLRSSYQDRPMQILKPGPNLHTGKPYQEVFVAGHRLFVLSGQRFSPQHSRELHQLEYLDSTTENPQWEVGSTPPFDDMHIGPYTVLDHTVIISGTRRATGEYLLYSYDFEADIWSEFDTTGWTRPKRDCGFFFCSGSQWMGDRIYSSYRQDYEAIPVLIRLHKHKDYKDEDELVLTDDELYDVVKHDIVCRHLSCTLVRLAGTQIGFLQVGNPPTPSGSLEDFNPKETHFSLAISDAFGGQGGVPKYLTSVHFVTYPGRTFTIDNAFMV